MLNLPVLPLALVAGALSITPASADVLNVGPAAPYSTIHAAVDDAVDGDIVLVAPGTYEYFGIFGKGVSVVADGGTVEVLGAVRIQNLALGQTATISGLEVRAVADAGLTISDCDGAVRIEDCTIRAGLGPASGGLSGAIIRNSTDVGLVGGWLQSPRMCFYNAFWDEWSCTSGGYGLRAHASVITLDGTDVYGGTGSGWEAGHVYGDGSAGIRATAATITLRGASVHGGDGGYTPNTGWGQGGNGGPGLHIDAATTVFRLDSIVVGGVDSWGTGPPMIGAGTVVDWPGTAPSSTAPSVVREGGVVPFHFQQDPTTRVDLLVSMTCDRTHLPALLGDLLVAGPYLRYRYIAGTTDATGALDWNWVAPQVPPLTGVTLRWQSAHVDSAGDAVLGRVHSLVVLDSAF